MSMTEPSRYVELEGCCNFRDLGGYPTADGRRTRWRRLFRADGLTRLSGADRSVLGSLEVRNVIDLRTGLEVESRGRFPGDVEGVTYHHLPLSDTLPGAEDVPDWGNTEYVAHRYASYLDGGADTIRAALDLLADPANLPAIFHCSVGKDRTGVLAAVVLGLLGVPDEVIVDDYALSKAAMVRILQQFEEEYPEAADQVARFAPVILSVEPASMTGFLTAVRERHGSFRAFGRSLGRSGAVEKMRENLLEAS